LPSQSFAISRSNQRRSIPAQRFNGPAEFFTVVFYGLKTFSRKAAQFCATRCEYRILGIPSVCDAMQRSENARRNPFLNYESPALTAELQARMVVEVKNSKPLVTNPESIYVAVRWWIEQLPWRAVAE
jgi:hypothetical protein